MPVGGISVGERAVMWPPHVYKTSDIRYSGRHLNLTVGFSMDNVETQVGRRGEYGSILPRRRLVGIYTER